MERNQRERTPGDRVQESGTGTSQISDLHQAMAGSGSLGILSYGYSNGAL